MKPAESDYLYLQASNIPNAGTLFTAIKIYKDEVVSIYKGEIITNKEAHIVLQLPEGRDFYHKT